MRVGGGSANNLRLFLSHRPPVFRDLVSQGPGAHSQSRLGEEASELRDQPGSASPEVGLQACSTMLSLFVIWVAKIGRTSSHLQGKYFIN